MHDWLALLPVEIGAWCNANTQDVRCTGLTSNKACPWTCTWLEVTAVSSPFSTLSSMPSSGMSSHRQSNSTACACIMNTPYLGSLQIAKAGQKDQQNDINIRQAVLQRAAKLYYRAAPGFAGFQVTMQASGTVHTWTGIGPCTAGSASSSSPSGFFLAPAALFAASRLWLMLCTGPDSRPCDMSFWMRSKAASTSCVLRVSTEMRRMSSNSAEPKRDGEHGRCAGQVSTDYQAVDTAYSMYIDQHSKHCSGLVVYPHARSAMQLTQGDMCWPLCCMAA